MNYKEKYEQALERARELQKNSNGIILKKWLWGVFPELKEKESEDERIRKALIDWIRAMKSNFRTISSIKIDDIIAWLEKQGEKKSYGQRKQCFDCQFNNAGECKGYCQMKRDEQKSADKVKPKFKVGDWVLNNVCFPMQIASIENGMYIFTKGDAISILFVDENYHLWTIADAKDGDVLVNGSNIFIFHFLNGTRLMGYCHINIDNGRFYDDIGKNECFCLIDAIVNPATKEQRDLLFSKMKEAGYEWDSETKEVKKIEVASKESEDEKIRRKIIDFLRLPHPQFVGKQYHKKWIVWLEKQDNKLDADRVIAWLVANIYDFEHYVKLFKKDFGL